MLDHGGQRTNLVPPDFEVSHLLVLLDEVMQVDGGAEGGNADLPWCSAGEKQTAQDLTFSDLRDQILMLTVDGVSGRTGV